MSYRSLPWVFAAFSLCFGIFLSAIHWLEAFRVPDAWHLGEGLLRGEVMERLWKVFRRFGNSLYLQQQWFLVNITADMLFPLPYYRYIYIYICKGVTIGYECWWSLLFSLWKIQREVCENRNELFFKIECASPKWQPAPAFKPPTGKRRISWQNIQQNKNDNSYNVSASARKLYTKNKRTSATLQ